MWTVIPPARPPRYHPHTGNRVLTASSDRTARLWDVNTAECVQVLDGHSDEIFSCAFNYNGDTVITGARCFFLSLGVPGPWTTWLFLCAFVRHLAFSV